jgi:hypothetical protein
MTYWILLVTTLPTENATLRQRAWRALKASGAAVLRDGVYLMPERDACQALLAGVAAEVRQGGGTAHLLRVQAPEGADFAALFDRRTDWAALLAEVDGLRRGLTPDALPDALRQTRKLRKAFAQVAETDFFPGEAQRQVAQALHELELACARALSPDEPQPAPGDLDPLALTDHQGRVWATRQRPWVDRLASAWLIRRFIDPQARLLWLAHPADCPPDALGFDFDGATFSHVGGRVTFEVLATRFGLAQPAVARLGLLVHALDVGGVLPPEAPGIESLLAGLRTHLPDDDQLLAAACTVFDGLLAGFDTQPQ